MSGGSLGAIIGAGTRRAGGEHLFHLRPWQSEDTDDFQRLFDAPRAKLCFWRGPFSDETAHAFGALWSAGWSEEPGEHFGKVFSHVGRPYSFGVIDVLDDFVDFAVVMLLPDGSAAVSGFLTPACLETGFTITGVRRLAEFARLRFGVRSIAIGDVPGRAAVARQTGLRLLPLLGDRDVIQGMAGAIPGARSVLTA